MSSVSQIIGIRAISIEEISVSSTRAQAERRARFDPDQLEQLAESVRSVGVINPIVVRPVNGLFELVAGERRLLAAQMAGMAAINASVRELTDEQVLEVQLIENLQREGLHELAEAEGYDALTQLGHSAEEIADKIGKSKSYVYQRMKLLALCPAARKAFYASKISASIALLLARIPVEELQVTALKHILKPRGYANEPLSYRDALRYVHEEFTLRLSEAPFPRDDATLVPAAGTCGACPKRTGNQPELFGDIKGADVCTDPACFNLKRATWNKLQIAKAKETGQPIITGNAARAVQPKYSSTLQGYVRPSDKCAADPKKRTYAQLVGKADVDGKIEVALLQNPDSGKFSKVYKAADVLKVLKEQGIKVATPAPAASGTSRYKSDEAKRDKEREFRTALLMAVLKAAPAKLGRPELELLALDMYQNGYQGDIDAILKSLGLDGFMTPSKMAKLSDADLSKSLLAIVLSAEVDGYGEAKDLLAAAKRYDVNPKVVRAALEPQPVKAAAKTAKKKPKSK